MGPFTGAVVRVTEYPRDLSVLSERAILDVLPRAVVVTDPSGRIVLWNRTAEELYGWSELEVVGRSVVEVLSRADAVDADSADLARVASGTAMTGDRIVVRRDGRAVRVLTFTRPIVDSAGNVAAIVGASEDVTELRLAEQKTHELSDHLRLALEAGGLGTWKWNMITGETVWDKQLEAHFGLTPGSFDGTFEAYVALLHPDDRETVLTTVREAVAARSGYRVEHRVIWPDGSVHWIAGAGIVTLDEQGEVQGTVGCVLDVTDRVTHLLERERLAAVAVEVAGRERVQRERLEFLGTINEALNDALTVRALMVNVTSRTVPRFGDWCSLHVLPRGGGGVPDVVIAHVDPAMVAYAEELQQRFPYDADAATGIAHVIRTGATEFVPDITDAVINELNVTDEERAIIEQLALRSAIAVPIVKRGRVLGAMQFVMSSSSRRYTEDDVTLAQTVAGRIASSLENHRLNDEQRSIARTLQHSLLPASLPTVPNVEIAVRYWPVGESMEVGGDFYDVFGLETDGRYAVVIGDVCGKGAAAAALTGLARHSIRESAWHGDPPNDVLRSLNRAIRRSESRSFLTAVYAVLDTAPSRPALTVTCAGHPLPIHATGREVTRLGAPGTLLGVLDDVRHHPSTIDLDPGDFVVFYTDGATDVPPPHALTDDEFAELVRHAAQRCTTAESLADDLYASLDSILSFADRDDDIALLVLRVSNDPAIATSKPGSRSSAR